MTALPSLRQLSYLLALHDHGHFGRAAAACFVTQSTLSVGIAELERLLGAALVERTRRTVRFTPLGEEVAARARGLVRAAEDLAATAQGAQEPLVGPLRLAVIPTVAPFLLPQLLPAIARSWPRLKLIVREMLTGQAGEALARGSLDCVLLALPVECGDVETVPILSDRLLLAAKGEPSGREDPERLLLLEEGHCLKDHALAACDMAASAPDAPLVASTLHTLVRLVDAGLGHTLLPEMAVRAGMLAGTGVTAAAIDGLHAERRIALAWRRGHARAAEFRMLAETVRTAVGDSARPDGAAQ